MAPECIRRCTNGLPEEDRRLILQVHESGGRDRQQERKALAARFAVPPAALRVRAPDPAGARDVHAAVPGQPDGGEELSMAALSADLQAKLDAYLLGRLSHGEQTQIETLLFEDDDVFEAVRDAEDGLIDRYLAGELTAADRAAFEHTFASSRSRQERIAFARALAHDLASRAPAQDTTPPVVVGPRAAAGLAVG
jgi:hypothetical protein